MIQCTPVADRQMNEHHGIALRFALRINWTIQSATADATNANSTSKNNQDVLSEDRDVESYQEVLMGSDTVNMHE